MKVSDIIRIGDKIDIRVLQEVEQAEKTDVTVKTYKSKVLDFRSNGNMEIAMPMEAGKLVLLQLGVRYELVFFSRESLYRAVGQVKERYKKDNIYMLEMELKSQPEKFQRREYFRYPCLLDFKYYELTAEQAMLDSVDAIFSEIRDEHFYEKERKGKIMDLSGGGIRFTTEQEQKPDTWILVELRLKSQTMDNQYYIVANVIETSKIESAAEYRFMSRAKFSIKNDRVREEIIRYIFEEERRMRQQNSSERTRK